MVKIFKTLIYLLLYNEIIFILKQILYFWLDSIILEDFPINAIISYKYNYIVRIK
jgi:hypothetical protein